MQSPTVSGYQFCSPAFLPSLLAVYAHLSCSSHSTTHTPASGFCMFLPSETFLLRCLFGSLLPPLEPLPSHHYDHPPLTSTCPTSGPLHSLSPYLASLSSTALNKLFVFLIYLFSLLSLECHSRGQIFVCLVHLCVPST